MPGLGTQLRRLLELLDGELETVYAADGLRYRPRYTPVMKALADSPPLTIKEIARASTASHSAASQTVKLMVAQGLLNHVAGEDGRERRIALSAHGRSLLPRLERHWRATQAAVISFEKEIGQPFGEILSMAIGALETKSFGERIKSAR